VRENRPTWSLRVRGDGADRAKVTTRQHQFTVGAPLSFDREYDRTTALEQALGALGADVVNGFTVLADRERVEIDDVEATVHAELDNALTYLGVVGEEGHPGLTRVEIKVYASSPAPEPTVREVWEEARRRSPLVNTFRTCVDLELKLQLVF
jgi:hypothetical protein